MIRMLVFCFIGLVLTVKGYQYEGQLTNEQSHELMKWSINDQFLEKAQKVHITSSKLQNLLNFELIRLSDNTGKSVEALKEIALKESELHLKVLDPVILRKKTLDLAAEMYSSSSYSCSGNAHDMTLLQKAVGYITLMNILRSIATCLIVFSLAWLGSIFIVPLMCLLIHIPLIIWEMLIWLICCACIVYGIYTKPKTVQELQSDNYFYISLLGCLGLLPCMMFSLSVRSSSKAPPFDVFSALCFILGIIWSIVTVMLESSLLAYLSVMAFQSALGFSFMSMPMGFAIGFKDNEAMARTMGSSLLLLMFYCGIAIFGGNATIPIRFLYFQNASLLCGGFIFGLGCLIVSSKYYYTGKYNRHDNTGSFYWGRNIFAIIFYIVGLSCGTLFPSLVYLQKICGTFLFLFCSEKYVELPWKGEGYAFAVLFAGIGLWCFSSFANQHPDYFFIWY
jgi:hypothetical protein